MNIKNEQRAVLPHNEAMYFKILLYNFALSFFSTSKIFKMYSNETVQAKTATNDFINTIRNLQEYFTTIEISFDGYNLVINNYRLYAGRKNDEYLNEIISLLLTLDMGKIVIDTRINKEVIVSFFSIITHISRHINTIENPFSLIESSIKEYSLPITVKQHKQSPYPNLDNYMTDDFYTIKMLYADLIDDFYSFQTDMFNNLTPDMKTILHKLEHLITILQNNTQTNWQGSHALILSSLSSFNNHMIGTHSVNVTILATAIGIALELNKSDLLKLAVSCFFHDIGITEKSVITTTLFHEHTRIGLAWLSSQMFSFFPMDESALIAAEHHNSYDCEGNFFTTPQQPASPLTDILIVADYYDLYTTKRNFIANCGFSKQAAIDIIQERTKTGHFNTIASKALISVVGTPPVAELFHLENSEHFAYLVGKSETNPEKCIIHLLDNKLRYIMQTTTHKNTLIPIEAPNAWQIPPNTLASILNSFEKMSI